MAYVVRNIGRLRPEIELGKAVSDFKYILSVEQNAAFQMMRAHALASPPTIRDVMNLTAEIDQKRRQQKGGAHRCFGPRFTMILESVQQYASLEDIIIGSSQNIIACGAWALTVVKFSTYLEKVSQLFMRVGLSAPRYCEMASLFPRSRPLQGLMAQYFVTVVRICHTVVSLCQQSFLGQVRAFIQDREISEYESQFTSNTNAIKEQLQLEQMKSASTVSSVLNSMSASERYRRTLRGHLQLLDQCSTYPYQTAWKRIRKQGNATWAYDQTEYKTWLKQETSSSLLLRGKFGSGKSVQMANMKTLYPLNEGLYWGVSLGFHTTLDGDEIVKVLASGLGHVGKSLLIIDGLEACNRSERLDLLQALGELQKTLQLGICVSFSLEASFEVERDMEALVSCNPLTLADDRPEFSSYIEAQLISKLEDGSLCVGDHRIILEIQDALHAGTQGMFLWAQLQIESLCLEKTDHAIRDALHLPKNLTSIFRRILSQCRQTAPSYQLPTLKILTAALRPLSLEEFQEVVSLTPGDADLSRVKTVNDIRGVLRCCGSLVILDEEHFTLHLIHQSVKQFLLGNMKEDHDLYSSNPGAPQESETRIPFDAQAAEDEMGRRLVTYLSWDGFDAQVSTKVAPTLPVDGVPKKILSVSLRDSNKAVSMAISLLRSRQSGRNIDTGKVLAAESKRFRDTAIRPFRFLSYAKDYWLHHTKKIHVSPAPFFTLFRRLVTKPHLIEHGVLWKDNHPAYSADSRNRYLWAISNSHTALFLATVDCDDEDSPDLTSYVEAAGSLKHPALLEPVFWNDMLDILTSSNRYRRTKTLDKLVRLQPAGDVDSPSILIKLKQVPYLLQHYINLVAQIRAKDNRNYLPISPELCDLLVQHHSYDNNSISNLLSLLGDMTEESCNSTLKTLLKSGRYFEIYKCHLVHFIARNPTLYIHPNLFLEFFQRFPLDDYRSDNVLLRDFIWLCPR
ncbi:hypothetical protein F4677DRAFT_465593 [Hypoxylon crocopeplum]|nr:hypothetical protein F4677DRAFT_465593 [Hypoxylon crocopeplum]